LFSSKESITGVVSAGEMGRIDAMRRTDNRFASPLATRITTSPAVVVHAGLALRRGVKKPMADSNILIVIPARMAATRLPGKPLAEIAGEPMIVHVLQRARAAALGEVVVATDSEPIFACVEKAGGRAVMTRADHVSGSDRIFEALASADPAGRCGIVVNVQGDLPTLPPGDIRAALAPLADPEVDIATLAAEIAPEDHDNPNVVKVVGSPLGPKRLRALYFTRARAPWGDGPLYHHIGLYAFRRPALARFVALKPSALELREKLEQLRALEAGMRIDVAIVDSVPLGVDTPDDLARARELLSR
jgi:3-deoxy-manno-octulosonate cytidylyltransferase (CMP-KDO synthetase)